MSQPSSVTLYKVAEPKKPGQNARLLLLAFKTSNLSPEEWLKITRQVREDKHRVQALLQQLTDSRGKLRSYLFPDGNQVLERRAQTELMGTEFHRLSEKMQRIHEDLTSIYFMT
ncbi:MAG: hypothetical protein Q9207_002787 [Kuettlingeria erythrocarpa]